MKRLNELFMPKSKPQTRTVQDSPYSPLCV